MRKILVSAGEASGDLYASLVVEELRRMYPDAAFFGCTGPRLRASGVETIVDAASLAVVGLVEVIAHIPRIYGEFRKLLAAAVRERPELAILTDSPDFHLRVARRLKAMGVPGVYLVAPRSGLAQGRRKSMRQTIRRLLCIFPFEEEFFTRAGIDTAYIGTAGRSGASGALKDSFSEHRLIRASPNCGTTR
jgi:lipid-A-disaccharide synthase